MSEFQYYEFRAVDRPLTKEAQREISGWSSRTIASDTRAVFTYHYGDFPKNARAVVEEYFDAMLYTANWGSTRLILKFPAHLVDVRALGQYSVEGLDVLKKKDTVMIDIDIHEEDGYDRWEEDEGQLSSLISLRNDIIAGDYRCLYLIWLKVSVNEPLLHFKLEQRLASTTQPPVHHQRRRTVGEIAEAVAAQHQRSTEKQKKAQEEERMAKFKDLEQRADQLWLRVDTLIAEKNAKSYDQALDILKELKALAIYKDQYLVFKNQVAELQQTYSRLSSLKHKISAAGLLTHM